MLILPISMYAHTTTIELIVFVLDIALQILGLRMSRRRATMLLPLFLIVLLWDIADLVALPMSPRTYSKVYYLMSIPVYLTFTSTAAVIGARLQKASSFNRSFSMALGTVAMSLFLTIVLWNQLSSIAIASWRITEASLVMSLSVLALSIAFEDDHSPLRPVARALFAMLFVYTITLSLLSHYGIGSIMRTATPMLYALGTMLLLLGIVRQGKLSQPDSPGIDRPDVHRTPRQFRATVRRVVLVEHVERRAFPCGHALTSLSSSAERKPSCVW